MNNPLRQTNFSKSAGREQCAGLATESKDEDGFSAQGEVRWEWCACVTICALDMPTGCQITGCKNSAPAALAEQQLCVLHYTLSIEGSCAEMRRETAMGNAPHERLKEIMKFLTESGERLARVATSGMPLTDDLKARILSTFLTLMNLRENLDRASMRGSTGRSGAFR